MNFVISSESKSLSYLKNSNTSMSVDNDILHALKDQVDIYNEIPMICQWVDKLSKSKHKNKRIFLVTETTIYLLGKKAFSKKITLSKQFNFFKMSRISFIDYKELRFEFGNTMFSVIHPEVQSMSVLLLHHLYSLMKVNELPKIDYPEKITQIFTPNPAIRFLAKSSLEGNKISHEDADKIRSYFEKTQTEFTASHFQGILKQFGLLLSCVEFLTTCSTLNIDIEVDASLAKILAGFILSNSTFTEIIFSAPIKGDLSSFAAGFAREPRHPLKYLTFTNFVMNENTINSVSKIINEQSLKKLTITSCLQESTAKRFFSKLEDIQKFRHIKEIDFSFTEKIYVKDLVPLLTNVKILNLQTCSIEVCQFLEKLEDYHVLKIETVDLTGNLGKEPFKNFKQFPPSLHNIILDEIDWNINCFIELFHALMKHEPGVAEFNLSFMNTSFKRPEWTKFFETINKSNNAKLTNLNWSNNNVDANFFKWIKTLSSLYSLNISGCIEDDPKIKPIFSQFIEGVFTLRELIIDSYGNVDMGRQTAKALILSIRKNYSFESLSLHDQPIGDDNYRELAEALMINRRIKKLDITFLDVKDWNTILFFFQTLEARGPSITIPYPDEVIQSFKEGSKIKDDFIVKIKESYNIVKNGNKEIKPPIQLITFADPNGNIPVEEEEAKPVPITQLNYNAKKLGGQIASKGVSMLSNISNSPYPSNTSSLTGISTGSEITTSSTASSIGSDGLAKPMKLTGSQLPPQPMEIQPNIVPPSSMTPRKDDFYGDLEPPPKLNPFSFPPSPQSSSNNIHTDNSSPTLSQITSSPSKQSGYNDLPPPPSQTTNYANLSSDLPPPPSQSSFLPPPPFQSSNLPPPPIQTSNLPPLPQPYTETSVQNNNMGQSMNFDFPIKPSHSTQNPPSLNLSSLPPPPSQTLDLPPPPSQTINQFQNEFPPLPGAINQSSTTPVNLPPPPSIFSNSNLNPQQQKTSIDLPPPPINISPISNLPNLPPLPGISSSSPATVHGNNNSLSNNFPGGLQQPIGISPLPSLSDLPCFQGTSQPSPIAIPNFPPLPQTSNINNLPPPPGINMTTPSLNFPPPPSSTQMDPSNGIPPPPLSTGFGGFMQPQPLSTNNPGLQQQQPNIISQFSFSPMQFDLPPPPGVTPVVNLPPPPTF
ncbi:hypothetical protein TRFO_32183 [Tritrichomonas foetus]|uniref:Uncharacterized protein n=1 Tax=Tritrichomonas foetus TaxID=1144522 RepID=A0A1J4JP88_9EUKA|nr:hypothetical protein TRFO_32183 [Tritrichomonas foetus]|eukprot:OHT00967.1 hypothetical protein TRFO_32183 [Tritrichomonas foetus]